MTGHKGLIGSVLKKRLEEEGYQIVLGIDKVDGREVCSLDDFELNPNVRVDMLIHCAALCKINKIIEEPLLGFENVKDVFSVLEFCRKNKIPKIIYFSSTRVLSKEKNTYTASKIYGEELCKAYKNCYGIDYLIIRPSTVYGPVLDRTKRLIHIFIVNALKNEDLVIYGSHETKTLDLTYIDDFIDGVLLAMDNDWNKEYDISGEEEFNIYDLAKFIISEIGSLSKIKVGEAEISQPQQVKIDNSEIKKLGYLPKVSLEEGVRRNIEYYKKLFKENPRIFDY